MSASTTHVELTLEVAKLFAMILEQRIAAWAEEHAVKAKVQAGFRKDFCMTDNIFLLR